MTDSVSQSMMVEYNQALKEGGGIVPASTRGGVSSDSAKEVYVKNLGDLKEQAPEVYNAMMMGIAQDIIKDMQDHQERIKEINDKTYDS